MRSTLFAVAASAALVSAVSADVITQWNFNDQTVSGGGTVTPNIGTGSATAVGGVTTAFVSGTGSSDGVAATMNDSWSASGSFAAQGAGSGTKGVRFDVSTLGYDTITLSFDQRNSNTGSRWWMLEYTTDGSTFSTAGLAGGGVYSITPGSTWINGISFDLSGIAGANNNASFGIRLTAIFAPGGSTYQASQDGSNYSTAGTARWDMVTINGNLVPGPGAMALLGLVGVVGARGRRR